MRAKNISLYNISFFQHLFDSAKRGDDYFFHEFNKDESLPKEPYRIEPYAIYLLKEGELDLTIDLQHYKIIAPSVFVLAPTVIRQCGLKDKGFDCQGIFFNKAHFLQNQVDTNYLDRYDFFYLKHKHIFPLAVRQYEKFKTYFDLIKQHVEENTAYTANILRSLIYILLNEVAAVNGENTINDRKPISHNEKALFEFKKLLSRDFMRHRSVSYYAQLLNLTPKHFSTIIKEESGKTAGEWIDEMVLLEAKVLLNNPELTIAQVSDALNFSDASTFGKFFKNLAGISPLDYRKSNI